MNNVTVELLNMQASQVLTDNSIHSVLSVASVANNAPAIV